MSFAFNKHKDVDRVILDNSWTNIIWKPDLFIEDSIQTQVSENLYQPRTYLILFRNGTVVMVSRLTALSTVIGSELTRIRFRLAVHFSCVNAAKYVQGEVIKCHLYLTTVHSQESQVKLVWNFVTAAPTLVNKLKLRTVDIRQCSFDDHILGRQPCLECLFRFSKSIAFYVVCKYIPSIVVVLISFASYLMPVGALTARLTLLLASLICICFLCDFNQLQASYGATVNLWLLICLLFVFLGFVVLLFAIVEHKNEVARAIQADKFKREKEADKLLAFSTLTVDLYARIIIPSTFCIFFITFVIVLALQRSD